MRRVLLVAAAAALIGSAARASASDEVTYTGPQLRVSAAAVVDFRRLARHERAEKPSAAATEEAPEPEGKEDADDVVQPNVHFTVPSPLVAPVSVTRTSTVASPYLSESFAAQPDVAAVVRHARQQRSAVHVLESRTGCG